MQLALDSKTNDLILAPGGGVERVDQGRFIVQLVQNKLKTILGEWLLDPSKGWLNKDSFEKHVDLFAIEMKTRKIILSVDGVKEITSMDLELTKDRVLLLSFAAKTIYGTIDLTVPWSN